MAPRTRSTSSISQTLIDALAFGATLKDAPYNDIARLAAEAGWLTYLVETSAAPAYSGGTLVTFDVLVGRAMDELDRLDQVTVCTGTGPGPVSLAARVMAQQSVIYLLTGRLPPGAAPVAGNPLPNGHAGAVTEQTIATDDRDVVLPGEEPVPENDGGEYVTERSEKPPVNVVARREPDGLPIFRDLYEIGEPEVKTADEVVNAVLDEIAAFFDAAKTLEQIDALPRKNGCVNPDGSPTEEGFIKFLKDFGTAEDLDEFKGMVNKRRNELQRPAGAIPRRRSAAVPRAN